MLESKILPLKNTLRPKLSPSFLITNGPIVAGIKPSLVSVRPNFEDSEAITVSDTEIKPKPPPNALQDIIETSGIGRAFIVANIFAKALASTNFPSLVFFSWSFIQFKSPPAQNVLPFA